jgi:hypothetical protein
MSVFEMFLLAGIVVILLGAGLAYFFGQNLPTFLGGIPVAACVSIAGLALFVVGLVIGWRHGFNSGRAGTPSWRGNNLTTSNGGNSTTNDSKVVPMHGRRSRNPLSALFTQIRILRLKMRYRRLRDHEDSAGE